MKIERIGIERIPLLASPQGGVAASFKKMLRSYRCVSQKEGWLRHQENVAKLPKLTQPEWFSFVFLNRKTTPASRSADASRHFIDCSATPPCGGSDHHKEIL